MIHRWLSVRAYCERYDVNRKTVYKYLDAGLLESWQVGRVLRVEDRPPGRSQPVEVQQPEPPEVDVSPVIERRKAARSLSLIRAGSHVVPNLPGVYVVRSGDAVKIGCSKTLRSRLAFMQTMFPHPLHIVGYIECEAESDAYDLESTLHAALAEHRIRGEWFRFTSPVAARLLSEQAFKCDERAMQAN